MVNSFDVQVGDKKYHFKLENNLKHIQIDLFIHLIIDLFKNNQKDIIIIKSKFKYLTVFEKELFDIDYKNKFINGDVFLEQLENDFDEMIDGDFEEYFDFDLENELDSEMFLKIQKELDDISNISDISNYQLSDISATTNDITIDTSDFDFDDDENEKEPLYDFSIEPISYFCDFEKEKVVTCKKEMLNIDYKNIKKNQTIAFAYDLIIIKVIDIDMFDSSSFSIGYYTMLNDTNNHNLFALQTKAEDYSISQDIYNLLYNNFHLFVS